MIAKLNDDKSLKSALYNLMVRIDAFDNNVIEDKVYKNFLSDLFLYNSGKGKKLAGLYGMVEKALTQWCGSDEDGNLCLDDMHDGFSLYEAVEFNENIDQLPKATGESELQ